MKLKQVTTYQSQQQSETSCQVFVREAAIVYTYARFASSMPKYCRRENRGDACSTFVNLLGC